MSRPIPQGARLRRSFFLSGSLLLAGAGLATPWASTTPPTHHRQETTAPSPDTTYDRALRLREALHGRPEAQRTRRDYERVLDAFRAVYHGDPRSPHADASVAVVAELLAEEGRLFEDRKASLDAIGEYEFLRRAYPGSRRRESALLTEGEIYSRELGDAADARAAFRSFLKLYPRSPLAEEARKGLRGDPGASALPAAGVSAVETRHRTVLDAARASRAPKQAAVASVPPAAAPQPATAAPLHRSSAGGGTLIEHDLPAPAPIAHGKEPAPAPALSETALNQTPAPRRGRLPLVTGVRHWSTPVYTRVAIDLEDEVAYQASRAPNPDRIFFDLHGTRLSPELVGKAVAVTDGGFLKRIRAAQSAGDVVRVVLDVSNVSDYSAFFLPNPSRLIIDIHGNARTPAAAVASAGSLPAASNSLADQPETNAKTGSPHGARDGRSTEAPTQPDSNNSAPAARGGSLGDMAALDRQPDTERATRRPTTAPVSVSVPNTVPAPQAGAPIKPSRRAKTTAPVVIEDSDLPVSGKTVTPADASAPPVHEPARPAEPRAAEARAASPTATGDRSMVRALGLKIGRIVVDAGHGGHDSGTLGPGGIEEKEVVLDVALRLGKLLKQRLGADVIYTRADDTFIPLETRTAIANKAQADLFLSVHANSSADASARGVETYYLNFTTSADALEVAARENAVSDQSIHQLSDLVRKITLQDKIAESREFAGDVEQSLYAGLEPGNSGLKDRGVKKAPFVVLIGANMPSILAEISFLTNPDDARQLRDPAYKQRIAESLYRGVAKYVSSLSGVRLAQGGREPAGE